MTRCSGYLKLWVDKKELPGAVENDLFWWQRLLLPGPISRGPWARKGLASKEKMALGAHYGQQLKLPWKSETRHRQKNVCSSSREMPGSPNVRSPVTFICSYALTKSFGEEDMLSWVGGNTFFTSLSCRGLVNAPV